MFEQLDFGFTQPPSALKRGRIFFAEYCRMVPIFLKLYFQNRTIEAQNLVLSFQLRMYQLTFWYCKARIFLLRLAHGFPVSQCWPKG